MLAARVACRASTPLSFHPALLGRPPEILQEPQYTHLVTAAQGPKQLAMHSFPYTTLKSITEFLPRGDALKWLTTTNNVETKMLRDEIDLEAGDCYEYETYLADIAQREYWGDPGPRRPIFESDTESEENGEPDGTRTPSYRTAFRAFDPDDPCDHNACLWRRWAGDD